jgi:hypothetical protein
MPGYASELTSMRIRLVRSIAVAEEEHRYPSFK